MVGTRGPVLPPSEWLTAWDTSPALVSVTAGPDHILVFQNRASKALFGPRPLGVPLDQAFPDVQIQANSPIAQAFRGEVVEMPRQAVPARDVHGAEVVLTYVLAPIGDPPTGVVITSIDVTAAVRAQEVAERVELVAAITNAITAADDADVGLKALTDALVPELADLAAVFVTPHHDLTDGPALPPQVLSMSLELSAYGPLPGPVERSGPSPWDPILRAGRTVIIPVNDETLPALAPGDDSRAWLRDTHSSSLAVVPLVVAGTLTGALVLVAAGDRPPYDESQVPFLEDIAARAGTAIATVRTHRRQLELVIDLQRALLPTPPTRLPGLMVAARYVAGAPDVEVGGDW